MKRNLMVFAIILSLFSFITPSKSQGASLLSDITCKGMFDQPENVRTNFLYIIDGYISSESETTIYSGQWLHLLLNHLSSYCNNNPNSNIDDALMSSPDYPNVSDETDLALLSCGELATRDKGLQTALMYWWRGYYTYAYDLPLTSEKSNNFIHDFANFCSNNLNALPLDFIVSH